ncbi:WG repeat-containing protein [Hymenobacter tibetensis]|uniref:WG repeat-containing protein n=1 Tax=Hymenobacter tibetensis TaxID=497967 RepID=A0ABY4CYI1_9BACT|nr:WG repeat-containing protein [Hymenobacter tibetensis]UOG75121.1 WG repeat-containing protein [Hymenobacter tibetensis]
MGLRTFVEMPGFRLFLFSFWQRLRLALCVLVLLSEGAALAQTTKGPLVPFRRGSRWGYADRTRRVVLPLLYNEAGPFVNEVAWVRQGLLYGYIDAGGNSITPVQFSRASNFQQGRATVELSGETFDINSSGQRLSTPPDPEPETDYLEQGDLMRRQGKVGFRFTVGSTTVVLAEYDEIRDLHHDGLLLVRQGAKWGVLNAEGKRTLPLEYDAIQATSANGFAYPIVEQAGRFGYVSTEGRLLTPVAYAAAEPFIEEVARVTTPDGKIGYIDSRGKEYFEE